MSLIICYLCYISSRCDERGLIAVGLGDWVDPFEQEKGYISSPLELIDSVTVYDMARKAAYLFEKIDRDNESKYAARLAEELRGAIRKNLIDTVTMTAANNCQTSQALTLAVGIFNEDERKAAEQVLINIIHRDGT